MTKEELTITNEDIELLKEMKNNCLKADVYNDEKRLLKANAITKFLMLQQENKELKERLQGIQEEQETYHTILTEYSSLYSESKHLKDKVSYLEERVAYLERSNNRREETILYEREENIELETRIDNAIKIMEDYTLFDLKADKVMEVIKILRGNE